MTQYERAAIKGFWRSGATLKEIAGLTGIEEWEIEKLIESFKSDPIY